MFTFLLEGSLMIGGMILGGQAIKLGLKWLKYGVRKWSPPDERERAMKKDMKNWKV